MPRSLPIRLVLLLASCVGLATSGCSTALLNMAKLKEASFKPAIMDGRGTEQRVVSLFTDALAEDNEPAFRRIVSTRFEQKAMRDKDSYKDLEILKLPKTKLEVVESKELEDNKFEAVAKEDKTGTKYQFIILRDPEKKRWVVDDIMLRQQKKGTRATKSSADVMDLLLTIREFLTTWQGADRGAVLGVVSTELRESLETLPEPWMQQVIARVSAECENDMARRPEAQMNESDAVVKMPSKNGFMVMQVARENEKWLISDIEVRKRKSDDHPGSVLRQARALNAVTEFLSAYSAEDHNRLAKLTEDKFYQNSLRVGDLSMIPLPAPNHAPDDFEIQSFAGQLTVMIPDKSSVARLDLTTPELAEGKADRKASSQLVETQFVIGDVTVYDRQTQQQRNLKSAFTSPARAMLFLSALETMDLPMLRQTSTKDFAEGSWDRIDPMLVSLLPLKGVPSGEMTLQDSNVQGEVTELQFLSSTGQLCSVIMRDENGNLRVDDVEYPDASATVASLRTRLMLSVPLVEMSTAWREKNLEAVKRTSSGDFNRLVWGNLVEVPDQFEMLPELLLLAPQTMRMNDSRAIIELAAAGQPATKVVLVRENRSWLVDEISMQPADGSLFELRKTLRQEIAKQCLIDPSGGIQQANYTISTGAAPSGVKHATLISNDSKPRGNFTMAPSGKSSGPNGKPASPAATHSRGIDMTEDAVPGNQAPQMNNGILQFGPSAKDQTSQGSEGVPPRVRPRTIATEDHDGIMVFRGAEASTSAQQSTPDSEKAHKSGSKRMPILDPSQSPIEIPTE